MKKGAYLATKQIMQRACSLRDKILQTGITRIIGTRLCKASALLKVNSQHKYTLCNIWGRRVEGENTAQTVLKGKKHSACSELLLELIEG